MKMLKNIAVGLKKRPKIIIIGVVSFLLISIFLYVCISLLRVTPAEIALKRLETSYRIVDICHEQCALERSTWEKIVVNDLKRNKKRVAKRLNIDWHNERTSDAFKTELVHIIYLAYGPDNPPEYLIEYFSDTSAEPIVMTEIITSFNQAAFARYNLEEIITSRISQATSSPEKLALIKTLSELNNDTEINNYFALLDSTSETALRREAVNDISVTRQKSSFFTKEQLEIIKKIVLAPDTDKSLRQDLIFLLGDYYLVYPDESLEIWQAVYDDATLDSLSRAFSADNLKHLNSEKVALPEVSASEWDDYYNQ